MTSNSSLPVRFGDLTKDNWQQLRALNMAVFPVRYSDKFYVDAVAVATSDIPDEQKPLTKLAFHGDVLVGAVQTKFEQPELKAEKLLNKELGRRLYIMTLGVLAPYRGHNIGRRLVELVLEKAQKTPDVTSVFLHVQINNDDAIQFYKKFGFEVTGTLEGYYKKIAPADCYIVEKKITH